MPAWNGPREMRLPFRMGRADGLLTSELFVGDSVLVRREPTIKREGPLRFHPRTYPGVFRISARLGRHTFRVVDVAEPSKEPPFGQPLSADRLVKLDLPEIGLDPNQPRALEIRFDEGGEWTQWELERFAADGRVKVRKRTDEGGGEDRWLDLTQVRYRWIL